MAVPELFILLWEKSAGIAGGFLNCQRNMIFCEAKFVKGQTPLQPMKWFFRMDLYQPVSVVQNNLLNGRVKAVGE